MKESQGRVLVVDDDSAIRRALHATLGALGFDVEETNTGENALALCKINRFDAVLLDINMPGMGGMMACRHLRHLSPLLPILMLTVRDSPEDIVRALDSGADDYIIKPFHVGELTARLRAAVRRNRAVNDAGDVFSFGDLEISAKHRTLKKAGGLIHLTPKEFDLLYYLMANADVPIPHHRLLHAVWGPEYGGELEYLRTFVRQLRTKIEDDASHPTYLLTDPYVGYRFSGTVETPIRNSA